MLALQLSFYINSLTPNFALPVFCTLFREFTWLQKVTLNIDLILLTWHGIMDLPKQLQCLAERTSRCFGEYISPGKYRPGKEFTCHWIFAHLFDLNMLGVQKQEMLLIWFSNDSMKLMIAILVPVKDVYVTLIFP